MSGCCSDISGGFKSLLLGISITGVEFFEPMVTRQYPWMLPDIHENRDLLNHLEEQGR